MLLKTTDLTLKFSFECPLQRYVVIVPLSSKSYKLACAPIEDSDQSAHSRSLIRVFNERSIGSQGFSVSSGGKVRLCPDSVDTQSDLNFRCMHMPTCTLCWIPAQLRS